MPRVILVTFSELWYQSYGGSDKKFDVNRLVGYLDGLNIDAEVINIEDLKSAAVKVDDYVFYTSSEVPEIREYIKDKLSLIRDHRIIPEFDLLLAHENKGYQSLLMSERSIPSPNTEYMFDVDSISKNRKPFVAKTIDGAGSSGVFLIKNDSDLSQVREKISFSRYLKVLRKFFLLEASAFSNYKFKHKGFRRFVVQEFIDDLRYDVKVLIFGNRYYCLKRMTRENDFRASGSGNVSTFIPSTDLLDFCESIKSKFDTHVMSLDIYEKHGFGLIEMQALNFGPTTLGIVDDYYQKTDSLWRPYAASRSIEENFSHSISHYLENHGYVK
jgi:glutathione synthase/RimK-type ligase-like ATP-grasp enzyme